MGNEEIIRVDRSLKAELAKLKEEARKKAQRAFGFEVNIAGNVASKMAAMKLQQKKAKIPFKIQKTGLNKGYIRML